MKIDYKTAIVVNTSGSSYENYEVVSECWCCEEMAELWSDGVCTFEAKRGYLQLPDWAYPINFCPFCGARIECRETQRVKLIAETEEYTATRVKYREEPA